MGKEQEHVRIVQTNKKNEEKLLKKQKQNKNNGEKRKNTQTQKQNGNTAKQRHYKNEKQYSYVSQNSLCPVWEIPPHNKLLVIAN